MTKSQMDKYTLYPLTHSEKRIYITQKTYPDSPMWNVMASIRIDKPIHPVLLKKAIGLVTAENQNLRIHFSEQGGQVRQYDRAGLKPVIRELDFIGHGGEEAYQRWLADERRTVLTVGNSPPHLFVIATVAQNAAYLCIKMHHIVADGHALATVSSNVVACYEKLLEDQVIVAGDNQAGFLDTISLEQDYLDSGDFEEDKDYWLNHFKTAPEMVELVPRTTTEDLEHE
ncbi:MAG: condensation domain-containing protein, partial [Thermodesulfobacteriota bacterium]